MFKGLLRGRIRRKRMVRSLRQDIQKETQISATVPVSAPPFGHAVPPTAYEPLEDGVVSGPVIHHKDGTTSLAPPRVQPKLTPAILQRIMERPIRLTGPIKHLGSIDQVAHD